MPFALLLIGGVILVSAFRGTYGELGTRIRKDMTGEGSTGFLVWLAAIGAVGAMGYSPTLRTPSRMLVALIVLAMLISNKGVFAKLRDALTHPPQPATAPAGQDVPLSGSIPVRVGGAVPVTDTSPLPVTLSGGGGGPGIIGQAAGFLGGLFG